uniref:riboflavin kinase n=1 Tax=Cyanistes caeruleus TaxID=156563 RepID=A0A8C0ZD91_CYACU
MFLFSSSDRHDVQDVDQCHILANFSEQVVESFPSDIPTGIYYGWACVGNGDVHKMVLSIGWNPFYKNIKKSVETHIIHTFKEDFYGEILSIVITGYIRPEKNFDSIDALILAIQEDIEEAKRQLDLPEHLKLKEDNFFHQPEGKIVCYVPEIRTTIQDDSSFLWLSHH